LYNFTDGELLTAKKLNDTFLECRTEAIDNSLVASHTNGTTIAGTASAAYWKKCRIVTGIVFAYPTSIQDGFTYMPEAGFPVTFQEGVCSITCTPLSGINNAQYQCQPPPGPLAPPVRRAFDAFLGEPSLSIRRIREDLNSAGHFTARGSEFSVDAVRYLLANPLYCGYIKHYASGELYPVQGEAFPPIVGEQTWRAAVAKLEDNVRRSARQGNQPKYLLSTIGLCGKCGATLVSGTNSRKQPTYRCGEQFHLTRQREPVDAMVTEAVLTRLSSVDVHDLVMPQEDDGPDREELLTERNALVDRVKELSPLLRDIHQPVLEITAAINDVKARIDEIDAELLDRSVSAAAKLLADVEEPVGTAERREVVEAKWKVLDVDRRRMLVDELVTVTIEPITPGHVKFDPDLIRIEPRRD